MPAGAKKGVISKAKLPLPQNCLNLFNPITANFSSKPQAGSEAFLLHFSLKNTKVNGNNQQKSVFAKILKTHYQSTKVICFGCDYEHK